MKSVHVCGTVQNDNLRFLFITGRTVSTKDGSGMLTAGLITNKKKRYNQGNCNFWVLVNNMHNLRVQMLIFGTGVIAAGRDAYKTRKTMYV